MKKILVANRGEIAIRIMRSARALGFSTVAVFSEADRNALHVGFADEAYLIGPSPPAESYLSIEKLIAVAKKSKAFAVHPGYGFLAENAAFARACEKAGLIFIGPLSKTIAAMGDKIEARRWAEKAGLPMVSASPPLTTFASARTAAKKLGYPVLLKAKAGGGGKGMREVRKEQELEEAFRLAQSEAEKSFKDDTLYLERYVIKPRHIEVQVFADHHGNVITLGDRECSIQRRHQKIIEEAPAPNLSEKTREKMAHAARELTRSVKYRGAGTIEFLVDAKENFYFLEMNTRLQVEHPVTEWVTGLDLVAMQIDAACGKRLSIPQDQIVLRGHAIEVRLYAEDPANRFFPSPGKLSQLQWPNGPGVRVDSGVEAGSDISLFYDPLLAKISVWGSDRKQALRRLKLALAETRAAGVKTNLKFLSSILSHPRFEAGKLTTTFIREEGPFESPSLTPLELDAALAVAALAQEKQPLLTERSRSQSAWWLSGLPKPRLTQLK